MIPIGPVKNMTRDFAPSLRISLKSILMVNNTRLAGNKYLDATKYSFDSFPETIPNVLSKEGKK